MKTVLRNLLSVLRRFKLATLLNLLGLSVAFTAFMLIMMQWDYDHSFDRHIPEVEKVFRVEEETEEFGVGGCVPRPLMDLLAKSPHVEKLFCITPPWYISTYYVETAEGKKAFQEYRQKVSSANVVELFHLDMVEGEAKAVEVPGQALLPESLARKMFGSASAVGNKIQSDTDTLTIVGVYRDAPKNSSFGNTILSSLGDEHKTSWRHYNYIGFFRLHDPKMADSVLSDLEKELLNLEQNDLKGNDFKIRFSPLADLHFISDVRLDFTPKASRQILQVLLSIAILIILIAGINFTNFSTALTPMRIRSINTQKVLGGQVSTIRLALVAEAMAIAFAAFLLSLFWIYALKDTPVARLLDADLSLETHPLLLLCTGLLALLTGLLAGVYPSFYMTSFPPALALKGSFGLSPKGRQLRNVLIGVQFIASFALIVSALFMNLQNYYMLHTDTGFDREAVIVTDISRKIQKESDAFVNKMRAVSGIKEVALSTEIFNDVNSHWGRKFKDQTIMVQVVSLSNESFLRAMSIPVEEGRDFRPEDAQKARGAWIFNEKAKKQFNMRLGDQFDEAEIIGFAPDLKISSFRKETEPMGFYLFGTEWSVDPKYAYIKVEKGSDLFAAMDRVRETLHSFDPDYPFNIRFYDKILNDMYEKELNLTLLITLFSLTAVFISIVGVFGLVVFDSEYRKKEIGIRKVLGSTTGEILVMFNKGYIRILLVCFVLAAPMAWYGISRWLENFAYKTPMYLWVYLVAFLVVTFITVCTVTFQNWRAANANPVDSIKSE